MIYNGLSGYLTGSMDQPVNTVLAMTKGPVKGVNWFATANPTYSITISSGAAGAVKLQGTNDVALRSGAEELNPTELAFLPTDGATWTDIQAGTSTTATGSITVEYKFLRLLISTQGAGTVTQAWVKWS